MAPIVGSGKDAPHPGIDLGQPARLRVGTRLGPYEIKGLLGSGGMGEVYRARDERLGREVAVKVLPADFASSPERVRRFEQEARAASALSHPHILAVYDVGQHEGLPYLVTELLAGETLASRMTHGPVPLRKALEWAAHAARGLTAVHEHGILHRDLKPSNLFVTTDGQVKILDFGLAKLEPPLGEALSPGSHTYTETRSGVLMGTVGYMSPEQVRGDRLDARSDQFSLGCVLYEMLSGHPPFRRATAAQSLAAVLEDEPPSIATRSPRVPLPVAWTVERCLAKDPQDRYAATRDLARDLELTSSRLSDLSGPAPGPRPRLARGGRILPWAAAVAIAATAVVVAVRRPASAPTPLPKRFVVALPDIDRLVDDWGPALVLVPDGSGFAYVGQRGGDRRIYLHTLADGASRPVPTTEEGRGPFFSPDGKSMGFVQDGKFKKIAVGGGPSSVIGSALVDGGAFWGSDDRIVFGGQGGLWQVPASGGRPERLTQLDAAHGEARHIGPRILLGGKAVLFTVLTKTGTVEDAAVAVVPRRGGEHRVLVRSGSSAHYVPSGHLAYVGARDLLVAPFDAERLALTGSPALAVAAVRTTPQLLYGQFDVSTDGTLVYFAGGGAEFQRALAWVDRSGTVRPVPLPARSYIHPRLLPGERGVIVEVEDTPHNIWHGDLRSGVMTRLTHEGANHRPALSPDGRLMAFSSDRTVPRSLFVQPTDGSGTAEHLLEASHPHNAESWSPDGRFLAFTEFHPETRGDIWLLPFEGERQPRPFLKTPFNEHSAVFSPDGRWLAYVSNESGRNEVLITAFPGPGPRKQVSMQGGETPVFSHDGRNLYYQMGDQVLAAGIVADAELTTSAPRVAFELPFPRTVSAVPNFAVSLASDSILTVKTLETPDTPKVHVVLNWFEELRRIAP